MYGFIEKYSFAAISFFSCNALECVTMNNQECIMQSEIINVNSNEPSLIFIVFL